MLLIHCENAILFYDYITGKLDMITSIDLAKTMPRCVELIAPNYCAIGCSDGHIRILYLISKHFHIKKYYFYLTYIFYFIILLLLFIYF